MNESKTDLWDDRQDDRFRIQREMMNTRRERNNLLAEIARLRAIADQLRRTLTEAKHELQRMVDFGFELEDDSVLHRIRAALAAKEVKP